MAKRRQHRQALAAERGGEQVGDYSKDLLAKADKINERTSDK